MIIKTEADNLSFSNVTDKWTIVYKHFVHIYSGSDIFLYFVTSSGLEDSSVSKV